MDGWTEALQHTGDYRQNNQEELGDAVRISTLWNYGIMCGLASRIHVEYLLVQTAVIEPEGGEKCVAVEAPQAVEEVSSWIDVDWLCLHCAGTPG